MTTDKHPPDQQRPTPASETSMQDEPSQERAIGGERSAAGSNYGDYRGHDRHGSKTGLDIDKEPAPADRPAPGGRTVGNEPAGAEAADDRAAHDTPEAPGSSYGVPGGFGANSGRGAELPLVENPPSGSKKKD